MDDRHINLLADFVVGLRYEDLPDEVAAKAREITLHAWGVQLAASTLPWSKLVYRYVRGQGGTPQSTVVGYGHRTTCFNAAFMNGSMGHAFELDDNHAQTAVKAGSFTVPAAFAVGEQQLASGKEFVTALVAGFEVAHRVGRAIRPVVTRRKSHATGTVGALGAAAITGKLLGLDQSTMVHALAAAAVHIIGSAEAPPTGRGHLKRTFGGMAAAGGVRAATLAGAGLTGATTLLEGGFCHAFEVPADRLEKLSDGLGGSWEVMNVHYKPYAQDGYIQPMSEALANIRAEHDFAIEDIAEVRIGTNSHAYHDTVGRIRDPRDLTDAQFSANFSVALFLIAGGAGFHEYTEENLHDPRIRELSERVVLEIDEEIDQEWHKTRPRGAKVCVRLASGKELKARVDSLRDLTSEEVSAKFLDLSQVVLDETRSSRLHDTVRRLDEVRDVSTLAPLLVR